MRAPRETIRRRPRQCRSDRRSGDRGGRVALPDTISSAAAELRAGATTSEALVEQAIERTARLDGELGVFVTVCTVQARASALRADGELGSGIDRGPLHGIPVAVKDILATADAPTTAQSRAFDPTTLAGHDAAAVRALRLAGAVILGKTSLSEFAIGLPDPESGFPYPRNPWNTAMWAGGSSAGTASGLAAGLFLGGIGTDTGGSVRLPAAFCGVTGLKPSRGLVPRDGCVPLSPSLDEIGPLARSAYDCALLLDALAPPTPGVSYAATLDGTAKGLRVGVDRHELERPGVDPAAVAAFERSLEALAEAGALVTEVEVRDLDVVSAAAWIVILVEALDCHRAALSTRWEAYGAKTRLRIAAGAFFSADEYARARRILEQAEPRAVRVFDDVDVLVTLAAGTGAWPIDDIALDLPPGAPLFLRAWNGLGFPALCVPAGFDERGLPLAVQLVGAPGADATVLRAGHAFQTVTDWHLRRPQVTVAP